MHNQVSSIYRNQYNAHALERQIDAELKITELQSKRKVEELEHKLQTLHFKKPRTSIHDFVAYKNQERIFHRLEEDKKQVANEYKYLQEKTSQLKPDHVASLVILATNSKQPSKKELFSVDPYRCFKCGTLYTLDPIGHIHICPNKRCRQIKRMLLVVEDRQNEIISFKNQEVPLLHQNVPTIQNNIDKNKTNRGSGERVKPYREYLMQFEEHAPFTPDSIKTLLYLEFNHIHMLNSLKCRSSAVAAVLGEQEPAIAKFQSFAIRITKEFNGDPIPVLTLALIENCCQRFLEVSKAAAMIGNFGKLPSFEILTHTFLRAEKRDDLAILFSTHKTSNVLRSADIKIRDLIDYCAQKESLLDWSHVPFSG